MSDCSIRGRSSERRGRSLVMLCCLAAALAIAGPAWAQTALPPEEASAEGVQEIIVIAQRREQSLQKVPIAVSALDAATALNGGGVDTRSLSNIVPSLVFSQNANGSTPFLRGIGSPNGTLGSEPSVAIYMDGVYNGSPSGTLFSFANIDRIEVAKGPQGTLFGRNATGGVIQIITKDPSETPAAKVSVGYSSYQTFDGTLYATTGMAEGLSADISVVYHDQAKGWGRSLTTGQETLLGNELSVRNKWLWRPGDATEVRLSFDYNRFNGDTGNNFHTIPGTVALDGSTYAGFYNTNAVPIDRIVTTQYGGALNVSHDLEAIRIVSITSYRHVKPFFHIDQDYTPTSFVDGTLYARSNSFTQELQLQSNTSNAVQWIVGAFYYYDRSAYDPVLLTGILGSGPLAHVDINASQETNSYAVFGQGTTEILPDTNLTLGLRYTRDYRAIEGDITAPVEGLTLVPNDPQKAHFGELTWRMSLDRQFTPDVMGYVSYNRGFKSGTFNMLSLGSPAVRPEQLDAYEIGIKSKLLDRRLQFNGSVFFYDYKDIQVIKSTPAGLVTLNAAAAEIKGYDVDVTALPLPELKIQFGAAGLYGRYTDFKNAPIHTPIATGGVLTTAGDATGFPTVYSPKLSLSANAVYSLHTDVGDFDLSGTYSYNSGYSFQVDNQVRQPSYSLVNASLGFAPENGRVDMRLWIRNIFNTRYFLSKVATDFAFLGSAAAPRTAGVTVSVKFGS